MDSTKKASRQKHYQFGRNNDRKGSEKGNKLLKRVSVNKWCDTKRQVTDTRKCFGGINDSDQSQTALYHSKQVRDSLENLDWLARKRFSNNKFAF